MRIEPLERIFPRGVQGVRIHAVGAGGHGISAALALATLAGAKVTGCDATSSAMADLLQRYDIPVHVGHDADHIADADLVVVSPAVTFLHPDLPELALARERGIPVAKWQALLGLLMTGKTGVSVAGVHGKGSTTALLGHLAISAGLDPTVEVGEQVLSWGSNIRPGSGPLFINEADEFDYNFLYYHPRVAVLTAVEFDHPEFFAGYDDLRRAFLQFLEGMDTGTGTLQSPRPALVLNADSPGCMEVRDMLNDWRGLTWTFGIAANDADVRADAVSVGGETSFDLSVRGERLGRVTLRSPGRHAVANALGATAGALALGVPKDALIPALESFTGLHRRYQIVPDGDITFVDDYAHHPHAVAITLETTRLRFPGRRIIAVFQPTLYTRLYRFLKPFSEAFDTSDVAVIVETQASREVDTGLVHGRDLVRLIADRPAFAGHRQDALYGGTYEETAALLRDVSRPGDVIVVMGSGPVDQVITLARTQA